MNDKTARIIRGVIVDDYNGYTYDVKEKFIEKTERMMWSLCPGFNHR